jgi:hypothetical protein
MVLPCDSEMYVGMALSTQKQWWEYVFHYKQIYTLQQHICRFNNKWTNNAQAMYYVQKKSYRFCKER